jgi:hypothetical protein
MKIGNCTVNYLKLSVEELFKRVLLEENGYLYCIKIKNKYYYFRTEFSGDSYMFWLASSNKTGSFFGLSERGEAEFSDIYRPTFKSIVNVEHFPLFEEMVEMIEGEGNV